MTRDTNLQRRVLTIWTDVGKGTLKGVPLEDLQSVGERKALRVHAEAARRLGRLNAPD